MAPSPPFSADAPTLGRRRLLQLGAGAAVGLPALLTGCRRQDPLLLLSAQGAMPAAWMQQLPAPWRQKALADPAAVVQAATRRATAERDPRREETGLLALSDGWALDLPRTQLQPFGAPALLARLTAMAQPISRLFAADGAPAWAFPWAFSPWVLVLRNSEALANRARGAEGWGVLLDPGLRQQLILPASPRISLELCGADPGRLRRLRAQALAYDERDALNLLLNGAARAAVVPLQQLVPLLRRDQRLQVVLPASGAPLTWQLLLRPNGAPPPPLEWLGALLEPPLLPRLLAGGWVPPLPRSQLAAALGHLPQRLAPLLLPPAAVLQRCWSLEPLSPKRQQELQTLWDNAAA